MTVGRVLDGRYRTDQLLGSGGMGTVWRGRDLRLDRPVAVKELAGPGAGDTVAVERFDREARTVARLAHPNVVAVYDVGADGAHPYLVMELVEGRSIAEMLADGPLPLAQAVAIAAQVCDGLTAAHEAGVIHRDIKPANLILTPAGVVKICDFGIARLQHTDGQADLTGTSVALGSSKFMAPEQATSEPVDQRTDLYGLGCTLYAMLAGAPPFIGDQPIGIIHQHLTQSPQPVRDRRPDVPPALDALVSALLAKAPAERPGSAAQVKVRLTELYRDLTGSRAPSDVPGPTAVLPAAAVPAADAVGVGADQLAVVPPVAPGPADRADPAPPAERTTNRALTATALLAAAGVVLALAALLPGLFDEPSGGPSDGGTAAPATTVSAPVVPAPATPADRTTSGPTSAAPQPTASASVSPTPTPPADPIASMRLIVLQQSGAGALDRKQAEDLTKKINELGQAVADGDVEGATKKIKDIRARLDGLLRDNKIDPTAHQALNANLDRIAATLP